MGRRRRRQIHQKVLCSFAGAWAALGIGQAWGDLLHDLYLGPGADIIACGIVETYEHGHYLNQDGLPCTSANDAYKCITQDLRKWCKDHKIRCPPIRFNNVTLCRSKKTEYPTLPSYVKASHVKVLLSWMADFCMRHGGTDIRSQLRRTLFYGVAAFIWILDHAGEWLKDDEAVAQYEMGYLFLESLQALSANAQSTHERIWKIRPKHHYLCHTIDDMLEERLNVKYHANWMDEDFIGKLARLGRQCNRTHLSERILQRYLLFVTQLWSERKSQTS